MHCLHGRIVATAVAALISLGPGLGSSRIQGEEPLNSQSGTINETGPRKLALLVGISQYERARIHLSSPRTGGTCTARAMWIF